MGLTADESDAGQQEHGRRLINRPDKRTTVETITVVLPLKTAAAARRGKILDDGHVASKRDRLLLTPLAIKSQQIYRPQYAPLCLEPCVRRSIATT